MTLPLAHQKMVLPGDGQAWDWLLHNGDPERNGFTFDIELHLPVSYHQ